MPLRASASNMHVQYSTLTCMHPCPHAQGQLLWQLLNTWATDAGLGILLCQIAFMSLPHAPTEMITPH